MRRTLAAALAAAMPTLALANALPGALDVQPVAQDVWAIVGETEQHSPTNLANNARFGLVVTPDGAVRIDPGGSYKGARALHAPSGP